MCMRWLGRDTFCYDEKERARRRPAGRKFQPVARDPSDQPITDRLIYPFAPYFIFPDTHRKEKKKGEERAPPSFSDPRASLPSLPLTSPSIFLARLPSLQHPAVVGRWIGQCCLQLRQPQPWMVLTRSLSRRQLQLAVSMVAAWCTTLRRPPSSSCRHSPHTPPASPGSLFPRSPSQQNNSSVVPFQFAGCSKKRDAARRRPSTAP